MMTNGSKWFPKVNSGEWPILETLPVAGLPFRIMAIRSGSEISRSKNYNNKYHFKGGSGDPLLF